MEDLCDMTLDKFKLWSVNALKVYLARRNKSVDGTFEELSARAFCAWEENIPIDETAEQKEIRLLQEYKMKLRVGSDVIPDPFSIKTGWKGEKTGMEFWPSVYITDIATYLQCHTPREVVNRVVNEYKEGKAYRYFDCGWVKEVFFHEIRYNSDKCILKAKVTPSQSINNKNYDVWVLVTKKGDDRVGGEILNGYCSCTAGMLGTCNHIAGLLFRVEHAVKTGLTSSSCTDKLCQWTIPKNKTVVKPVKVSSVSWKKSSFFQKKQENSEEDVAKSNFTPLSKVQCDEVKNHEHMRQKLFGLLKTEVPNSVFVLNKEKKRLTNKSQSSELPPSLISVAVKVRNMNIGHDEKQKQILQHLQMTPEELEQVKLGTVRQSESESWRELRKGRVTASNFKRVCSRVNTLTKEPAADASALVSTILGEGLTKQTVAMKHGLSLEPFAKKTYSNLMKKKHQKFESIDSGLSIDKDEQYLAASADLEVECHCCGKGLCEIKCPESIKGKIPSDENVSYIKKVGNDYEVDRSHQYFYQIQGQMGILGRKYCDLFIFTVHGNITIRVNFEESFWEEMRKKLMWFWKTYILKELTRPENTKENPANSPPSTQPKDNINKSPSSNACQSPKDNNTKQCSPKTQCTSIDVNISNTKARRALQPIISNQERSQKLRKTKKKKQPVFLCGTCGLDCVDTPQSDSEQSVNCDLCNAWVHYICAGVDDTVTDCDEWVCQRCK